MYNIIFHENRYLQANTQLIRKHIFDQNKTRGRSSLPQTP